MTPEEIAIAILESEAFMWLMVGSNHTEAQLKTIRPAWNAYIMAGGKTWGKRPGDRQGAKGVQEWH